MSIARDQRALRRASSISLVITRGKSVQSPQACTLVLRRRIVSGNIDYNGCSSYCCGGGSGGGICSDSSTFVV